jgi:hypothetical protein
MPAADGGVLPDRFATKARVRRSLLRIDLSELDGAKLAHTPRGLQRKLNISNATRFT